MHTCHHANLLSIFAMPSPKKSSKNYIFEGVCTLHH